MYETIRVLQFLEANDVLDAEGPLDEEANFSDRQSTHQRKDSGSASTDSMGWSTITNVGSPIGSPMDAEGRWITRPCLGWTDTIYGDSWLERDRIYFIAWINYSISWFNLESSNFGTSGKTPHWLCPPNPVQYRMNKVSDPFVQCNSVAKTSWNSDNRIDWRANSHSWRHDWLMFDRRSPFWFPSWWKHLKRLVLLGYFFAKVARFDWLLQLKTRKGFFFRPPVGLTTCKSEDQKISLIKCWRRARIRNFVRAGSQTAHRRGVFLLLHFELHRRAVHVTEILNGWIIYRQRKFVPKLLHLGLWRICQQRRHHHVYNRMYWQDCTCVRILCPPQSDCAPPASPAMPLSPANWIWWLIMISNIWLSLLKKLLIISNPTRIYTSRFVLNWLVLFNLFIFNTFLQV